MIYDKNKLLLQNRIKDDWCGYTFPEGHVEKGESFVHAAIREVYEETGVTIEELRICGVKQFNTANQERYIVILFKSNQYHGTLTSSEEGEMVWVDRNSLSDYPLAENFMEMLSVFDSDSINEFMYERDSSDGSYKVNLY